MSMFAAPPRTSYDELPYPSFPYPLTHPDRLATIATLLGLKPARAKRCWVLELGCAGGGNLIPLALAFPESTFVGIDLSAEQLAEGQRTIAALGLTNISLRHLSILDIGDRFGGFDFIICHGVYSWVPAAVQEKILRVYKQCLAPSGVGFISYNTFPGWHMRGMVRAMMGLHDRRFRDRDPLSRVGQARALLSFLAKSAPAGDGPYNHLLKEQLGQLSACSDAYLFHEHLEECNEPIYFVDFCDRLAAAGLRFLAEAEMGVMVPANSFPAEVQEELSRVAPNQIELEQYMDLLRNRSFRQTLVCHDHVAPCYDVAAEHVFGCHVTSHLTAKVASDPASPEAEEKFEGKNGLTLVTASALVKAAVRCLADAWPRALAFEDLLAAARARARPRSPASSAEDALELARALLKAFVTTGKPLVELSICPPALAAQPGERPLASPLARLQARTSTTLTNLRHETVVVPEVDRFLLQLMDGSRDRAALVRGLVEQMEKGDFKISADEVPVTESARVVELLAQLVEEQLPILAREALLIA